MLEVTGSQKPKDYLLDGKSLVPLLKDASSSLDRPALFWHFPAYLQGYTARHGPFRTTPAGAIRMGDWKLIEYFEDNTLELYNLKQDLGEKTNLAQSMPEKTRELHQALLTWRQQVKAPVPTEKNPRYDPNARFKGKRKSQ